MQSQVIPDFQDNNLQPVFATGVLGQPKLNLSGESYAKSGAFRKFTGGKNRRARSQVVMQAVPDGKEDFSSSSEIKSDKAPWQRGFETYVRFNGNPLEKVVPFIPKQKTTIDTPQLQKEGMFQNTAVIFKYDKNLDDIFGVLDDVVMGGKSLSQATIENEGGESFVKFAGFTDTNGGGFCSVRTKNFSSPLDLSEYKGITFKARSLKNFNYKINLRDEENWDSIAW